MHAASFALSTTTSSGCRRARDRSALLRVRRNFARSESLAVLLCHSLLQSNHGSCQKLANSTASLVFLIEASVFYCVHAFAPSLCCSFRQGVAVIQAGNTSDLHDSPLVSLTPESLKAFPGGASIVVTYPPGADHALVHLEGEQPPLPQNYGQPVRFPCGVYVYVGNHTCKHVEVPLGVFFAADLVTALDHALNYQVGNGPTLLTLARQRFNSPLLTYETIDQAWISRGDWRCAVMLVQFEQQDEPLCRHLL